MNGSIPMFTGLTPAARNDLIEFCAAHLKSGVLSAERWADQLIADCDFSRGDYAHFEIPAHKTHSGHLETITFGGDALTCDAG